MQITKTLIFIFFCSSFFTRNQPSTEISIQYYIHQSTTDATQSRGFPHADVRETLRSCQSIPRRKFEYWPMHFHWQMCNALINGIIDDWIGCRFLLFWFYMNQTINFHRRSTFVSRRSNGKKDHILFCWYSVSHSKKPAYTFKYKFSCLSLQHSLILTSVY